MSDLMYEPTEDKSLEKWQKWANEARMESIRADKAEALCDTLLAALKAVDWVYVKDESIYADPGDQAAECPWCGGQRDYGDHNPYCQRQAAIAAVEEEQGETA